MVTPKQGKGCPVRFLGPWLPFPSAFFYRPKAQKPLRSNAFWVKSLSEFDILPPRESFFLMGDGKSFGLPKRLMRILVIDDEKHSADLLAKILSPWSTVEIALSGKEGLTLFTQGLDHQTPFDLVFLDIVMPDLNGHQVLEGIRRIEAQRNHREETPVVIATVKEDGHTILQSFAAGAQHFFTKPYDRQAIFELLKEQGLLKPGGLT
ncbi:MAG: hypothetical protein A2557_02960 [Candidatus Lambdaproteobacteria bacterium RIFOXYD2_FULL_56_26]|uniref:Response regulatory domain-containing protein n=1 Tax=Candidatus Lambdaproteobacteria bacterium RIFOXYD2_FULL_56_26 TaxID=1817773 RepID=A0A1F6GXM0_9PROT|nr:MAG: hypothetical protein A2557_02960 [Candidatus Lambdaproteobacteria bacterium RIFOXYD2_FULL_56_26]